MTNKLSQAKLQQMLWDDMFRLSGEGAFYRSRHQILELIFLKRLSEAFESRREELLKSSAPEKADIPEVYASEHIFWIPEEARWARILKSAQTPMIGETINRAMKALEVAHEPFRGMLSHNYASPWMDQRVLSEIVFIISKLRLEKGNLSDDMFMMELMHIS